MTLQYLCTTPLPFIIPSQSTPMPVLINPTTTQNFVLFSPSPIVGVYYLLPHLVLNCHMSVSFLCGFLYLECFCSPFSPAWFLVILRALRFQFSMKPSLNFSVTLIDSFYDLPRHCFQALDMSPYQDLHISPFKYAPTEQGAFYHLFYLFC